MRYIRHSRYFYHIFTFVRYLLKITSGSSPVDKEGHLDVMFSQAGHLATAVGAVILTRIEFFAIFFLLLIF